MPDGESGPAADAECKKGYMAWRLDRNRVIRLQESRSVAGKSLLTRSNLIPGGAATIQELFFSTG